MPTVDFGTYHHTTPKQSKEIRNWAQKETSKLLPSLYSPDSNLRILDAGCGLGFLASVAAKCFSNANIIGVDLFGHESMSDLSIDRAVKNVKALGIDSRVSFLEHDLTKPLKPRPKYDLVLSNLVFHNMGKQRFEAYGTVLGALKKKGYFVIGDLFPPSKADMDYLLRCSTLVSEIGGIRAGRWVYGIKVLRKK